MAEEEASPHEAVLASIGLALIASAKVTVIACPPCVVMLRLPRMLIAGAFASGKVLDIACRMAEARTESGSSSF